MKKQIDMVMAMVMDMAMDVNKEFQIETLFYIFNNGINENIVIFLVDMFFFKNIFLLTKL